jgi:hypothetical protein
VSSHPKLAVAIILGVGLIVGLGAVVAIGIVRERLRSRERGYQVRRLDRGRYVYEEESEEGPFQQRPVWQEVLASFGLTRPRTEQATRHIAFQIERIGTTRTIRLPDQAKWDEQAPSWARGRRAEIIERINESLY